MSQPPNQPYDGQAYPEHPGQPSADAPGQYPPGQYPPPQYPPPQYPPPGYGPPGYPQAGYGPLGYNQYPAGGPPQAGGPFPPPTPPTKSRALPIVLSVAAAVLVLCVAGAGAVFIAARDKAGDIVDAARTTGAAPAPTVTGTADPTPTDTDDPQSTAPKRKISLVTPTTLGGRRKNTDPEATQVAKGLQKAMAGVPGATDSVGAVYGTAAGNDIVLVAATAAAIDDPEVQVKQWFDGALGSIEVSRITDVDAGPLGGAARCGSAKQPSRDSFPVCAWADDGSTGMLVWYAGSLKAAKGEFAKLRGQVERTS